MTLTNPFGIDRYLHPRKSGIIAYKGGGGGVAPIVETVVDGGLSDDQYNTLLGRIGSPAQFQDDNRLFPTPILFDPLPEKKFLEGTPTDSIGGGGIDPGFGLPRPAVMPVAPTGLYAEADAIGKNLDTGFADVTTGIAGVNTGIAGVNTGLNTGFSDITSALDTFSNKQTAGFDTVNTNMGTNAAAINAGISGLQTGQDAGFADVGTRFDTVDQANVNMQTAVDQGFQDQAQGFTDVNANMSAGFDANAAAVNTGFTDAATALAQGFGDASTQLTNTQANVLEGQQGLGTQLDTMGATADAYAAQSLTNQDALQSGQDSFVSSFDTYVDRYSDDTELAQNTRADIQKANANANQALRNDMARTANAEEVKAAEIARNVQAIQINQAKNAAVEAASNPNLDQGMRQNFANLGTSFNNNGALIPTTVDRAGNRIVRSLDNQGNLILNSFNSLGQPIGTQNINIAQSLNILGQMSNPSTRSSLTPVGTRAGIASPYMTT